MRKRPMTASYSEPLTEDGDAITVAQYLDYVAEGTLTDADGFGYAAREGMVARASRWSEGDGNPVLRPSLGIEAIPEDATHVVWFNQ